MGNCYYVARELVLAGVVEGQVAFGWYDGPIHPSSAHNLAEICEGVRSRQHGWVILPDGRVLDPTRWVFEDRRPYIYAGDAEGYNESDYSVSLRARGEAPPPDHCCVMYVMMEKLLTRDLRVRAAARDVVALYGNDDFERRRRCRP
jgi:hypothetical protein